MTVGKFDLRAVQSRDAAIGVENVDGNENVADHARAGVPALVISAPPTVPGNARQRLDAREPLLHARLGELRQMNAGAHAARGFR